MINIKQFIIISTSLKILNILRYESLMIKEIGAEKNSRFFTAPFKGIGKKDAERTN